MLLTAARSSVFEWSDLGAVDRLVVGEPLTLGNEFRALRLVIERLKDRRAKYPRIALDGTPGSKGGGK